MLRDEGHVAHVQHDTFGSGTKDVDWLPESFVARVTASSRVGVIDWYK